MDKNLVNEILREYEKKRFQNEILIENRMKELVFKHKELADIEDEIREVARDNIEKIFKDPENKDNLIKETEKKLELLKNKREKFIKKLKLPKDYLEVKYECQHCNDTGFLNVKDKLERCPCLKQKVININYNKSNLAMLEEENFDKFNFKYYSTKSNIEAYGIEKTPRENIEEIFDIAKKFVDNFEKESVNLLFSGDTGLRKNIFNEFNI